MVDTVHVGQRYGIWVWVEVPDEAVQRSALYLTAGVAGYAGVPVVVWPRGPEQTRLTPEQMNQPVLLREIVPSLPEGVENIKVVVSSDPYSLRPLVTELPRCPVDITRDRGRGGPDGDAGAVTGWTAVTRRIEIYSP
jgi:hypothetical protein